MEKNYDKPEVSGAIFGVDIERRCTYVGHNGVEYKMAPLLTLVIEDDEYWHRQNLRLDASWIDDVIDVLQRAKALIEKESSK